MAHQPPRRVGLLVTCLVDLMRPTIGFAAVKLLEAAGCTIAVPSQSCCGQPAWNSGDREDARAVALTVLSAFETCDYIVAPSGSCAGMVSIHCRGLPRVPDATSARARAVAANPWELVSFRNDVCVLRLADTR